MAVAILSIVFFVILLALLTAGAVLCLHLWARRRFGATTRILFAAVLGPGSMLALPLFVGLMDGADQLAELGLGLGVGGAFLSLVIGWPVAAILTRKLEKTMLPDPGIFE